VSQYDLVKLLLVALVMVLILLRYLLRRKAVVDDEDGIPGAEEMAKTYFFWSRYHGQNDDD
jgi:hypothetical protein